MFQDDTETHRFGTGGLSKRDGPLNALGLEDLSALSVTDLSARIEALRAEISRTEQALAQKDARRSEAEALFSFSKPPSHQDSA